MVADLHHVIKVVQTSSSGIYEMGGIADILYCMIADGCLCDWMEKVAAVHDFL